MGTLGVKSQFLVPKMTPNVDIMQITSQFWPFDNANQQRKYISSNLIAKTVGIPVYMGTPGGKEPKFWPKWPQVLVLCN